MIFLILFLILCIIIQMLIIFFLYQFSKLKTNQYGVLRRQNLFLQRWLRNELITPEFLRTKLNKGEYKRILIYGAGIIGQQIYYALDGTGIEVVGFIDKTVKEVGIAIPVYKITDNIPDADVIVVSVIYRQNKVIDSIHQYTNMEAVFIDQIL